MGNDIVMCDNTLCPLKKQCYRYNALPEENQQYAWYMPDHTKGCKYYIDMEIVVADLPVRAFSLN